MSYNRLYTQQPNLLINYNFFQINSINKMFRIQKTMIKALAIECIEFECQHLILIMELIVRNHFQDNYLSHH